MDQAMSSPARLYALVFGIVLTAAGVIGFFYEASFDTGEVVPADDVFGILAVNGWHNVVHLATGLLGLAAFGSLAGARAYALGLGIVYVIVAIWGFIIGSGETIVSILIVNTEDNVLHLIIGLVGLGAYFASGEEPAPTATT